MRPNKSEKLFLNLGYNRFYDLFHEIMDDEFWDKDDWYRFSKVSTIFSVYSELLRYEEFKYVLESIKKNRPPIESEIGGPFFKFIRNLLSHFPFFQTWDEVWINRDLVNWNQEGLSIDRFLSKYSGHEVIKYRFWEAQKKRMTYMSINFPTNYNSDKIYLKDIVSEKEGVKFSIVMMRNIINTQVESVKENSEIV